MSTRTQIVGDSLASAAVIEKEGVNGLVAYTDNLNNFTPQFSALINSTYGADMNQNVAFGGTPEVILDGAGGGWTPTALQGAWNFTDSGKVSITSANDNDSAIWDDAGTIAMTGYTAITGKVDLDAYNDANNSMLVQFGLAGVLLGVQVDLNDYIDTGNFAEQNFVIPKDDLGIATETVDEMTITMTRTGGTRPTVKFDDFQIEETGTPAEFSYVPAQGKTVKVTDIGVMMVNNVTTAQAQAYDTLMGVTAANGIGVLWTVNEGEDTLFNGTIREMIDFIQFAGATFDVRGDGTNSWVTINYKLDEFPPVMTDKDELRYTITDNLSGLTLFRVFVRAIEITPPI